MLSLLAVILSHKKTVLLAALAGFVVSAALSMVIPVRYISWGAFVPGGVELELIGRGGVVVRLIAFIKV